MRFAWFLSFSVGFLSLSQEILWVRLVSFGQTGRPQAFSIVLAAFLVGIAAGAVAGRHLCERSRALLSAASVVLLVAGLVDLVTLHMLTVVLLDSPRRLAVMMTLIAINAGLKGVLFPVVHHLGAEAKTGRVGRSVSRVYFCNVLGSTLGPILTGFFLLDVFSVETVFALIGGATLTLGLVTLAVSGVRPLPALGASAALVIIAVGLAADPPDVVRAVAGGFRAQPDIPHVVQNRHGIVHIVEAEYGGDETYGGNMYDGRINVDIGVNSNLIDRAYLVATLHQNPRRALVVGLSTGAWTKILLGFPGVEVVDVVEINPGYLGLVSLYPEVASVLDDPRVHIHIDDARRWLRANPEKRYDIMFQNTTWHWRANATMLLSADYFRQMRGHLAPDGIMAVNSTGSLDVFRTAVEVFSHVVRYSNFAYMSNSPLRRHDEAESMLRRSLVGTLPAFSDDLFEPGGIGRTLLTAPLQTAESLLADTPSARVITDMNLLSEFRHGRRPLYGWLNKILPPEPEPLIE